MRLLISFCRIIRIINIFKTNNVMIKLNKNKVYDLSELTSEQFKQLYSFLGFNHEVRTDHLLFDVNLGWTTGVTRVANTINAKELFYTLENIQVDCANESEEKIKQMAGVFEKAGYKPFHDRVGLNLEIKGSYLFFKLHGNEYIVGVKDEYKTIITYDKFMELFGESILEVKINVKDDVSKSISRAEEDVFKSLKKLSDSFKALDKTSKPQHYSKGIDTFSRMEANCSKEECLAFAKGNIDKYNWREKGQDLEDFKKIISYANWAIKLIENGK